MAFDTRDLAGWDSSLLTFLAKVFADNEARRVETDRAGLPPGVRRLLDLAAAVPARTDTGPARRPGWLARVGLRAAAAGAQVRSMLAFLGEVVATFPRLLRGGARFRRSDFLQLLHECGAQALPIVSLISFLVGIILAYVGSIPLRQFGAQIFVANLVGLGMTREMGAMMAAIIMTGRTGAAFAAQLGTMQVNEEIDALKTLGVPPIEFLVLPRLLALALMMPLLCLYADVVGMLGGAVVALGLLDIGPTEYWQKTIEALRVQDFLSGVVKSSVFGVLVAVAGCLRGMESGRSASGVGAAATSAVVTGIVCIIVSDALMTVVFDIIGF
jgi:phospholipid/cholesterol/gamma-HCH transport system permease protein